MASVLQAMGFLMLILLLAGATVVGLLGVVPVWSDILKARSPMGMGVKYSESDYGSGLAKIPGHTVTNPEWACLNCTYHSVGTLVVNQTFTQEEFTAQLNKLNSQNGPARDIQVKFGKNGTIELSFFDKDPGVNAPIYVRGKIESIAPKKIKVEIQSLVIGRISLPFGMAAEPANLAIEQYISKNPGLSIRELEVQEGAIRFVGTFPGDIAGQP